MRTVRNSVVDCRSGFYFSELLLAVRQCGVIAQEFQGRVANESKTVDTHFPNDSYDLHMRRAAKTVVDEVIQEVVILAAAEVMDSRAIGLDAEEATRNCSLFARPGETDTTLVIDPIDGTLQYLLGDNSYAVCVSVVRAANLLVAFILFPARDILYYLSATGRPMVAHQVRECGIQNSHPLECGSPASTNIVYINGRVPKPVQASLSVAGFDVVDDAGDGRNAPECILSCLRGDAVAYVSHTRQMRDIILGGLLAATSEGYACDWAGRELMWPPGGRVPRAVFGVGEMPEALLKCLRNDDSTSLSRDPLKATPLQ